MQGDIVDACPVAVFKEDLAFEPGENTVETLLDTLSKGVGIEQRRAIVMTQACDLEQGKIRSVILCPVDTLPEFQQAWRQDYKTRNDREPPAKEWSSYIDQITKGRRWNFTLLRKRDPGAGVVLPTPTMVVDFHEIYSLPLAFLKSWVEKSGQPRLRLCPPYREHLSQAFARFFMRVGPVTPFENVTEG
jgi:hypothetical protein